MDWVNRARSSKIGLGLLLLNVLFYVVAGVIFFTTWLGLVTTIENAKAPGTTERNLLDALFSAWWLPYVVFALAVGLTAFLCYQFVVAIEARQDSSATNPAAARKVGSTGVALVDETIELAKHWTWELNTYVAGLPTETDPKHLAIRLETFVNHRLAEANKNWLALPKEKLRFSVCIANDENKRLGFLYGNAEVDKTKDYFEYGNGLAGVFFMDRPREPLNEIDPSTLPNWKVLSKRSTFSVILIVMIEYGVHPLGVLCVTRRRREKFDASAVRMMQTLASILAMAIALTEERRARLV